MNELTFLYLAGESVIPSLLAFAATYYRKKGAAPLQVSTHRRMLSLVVIYGVCLGTELVLTTLLTLAAVANTQAYDSPLLILSGVLSYFSGARMLARKDRSPLKSA